MPESVGHLNPGSGEVGFDRFELGTGLEELVRHVWVVRWNVPAGEVREQRVLAYPAFNAVIEPKRAQLFGLDPRLDLHELSGSSWVIGVLFRPCAASVLTSTPPVDLLGKGEPLMGAPLAQLAAIMNSNGEQDAARRQLVDALARWLKPLATGLDDHSRLLNEVCGLVESDDTIIRVHELAERIGVSTKTLERLVKGRLGVSPKWLIECRRMQQAASRLHADANSDLASLAAELGYADYAHFSRQYRSVLGETPQATRRRQ